MSRDTDNGLHNTLSERVIFHSPVRDYHGRADVSHMLTTIGDVLDRIEWERELVAGRQLVTIITAAYSDHPLTGVLVEVFDAIGRVERATLLLRPLSTLLEIITATRAALERSPLPSRPSAS